MEFLRSQFLPIVRRLGRAPMFTAVTLLTLSLSIGATTAIFSAVECVLLKLLPYPHPEELVAVRHRAPGWGFNDMGVAPTSYFTYREQNRTFQDIGLYSTGINAAGDSVNVTGRGEPERVPALAVTDGLLPILGVTPLFGRSFTQADDSPGNPDTVLLTNNYWRDKFGADRSVIGKTIDVDMKPRVIIGVLPKSFQFLGNTNLALVLPMQLDRAKSHLGFYVFGGVARLRPGVTLAQANADVARMFAIERRNFTLPPGLGPKVFDDARIEPNVRPLKQEVIGDVGKILWVLMGGISLVLLIACANVANLLLVRAEGRQQELDIRAALGASRRRIATELFLEGLILAGFGGLLGLGLAYAVLQILVVMVPPGLPRLNEIGIDGRVVLFTLAVSLAVTLLSVSVPILKYRAGGLGAGLREGGRSMSETRGRHKSLGLLVIIQMALALVLLVSSGLMIRTFRALNRVNPGFAAPSGVQTFRVGIRGVKDPERVLRLQEEISRKLESLPGVSSVGVSRDAPMDGGKWTDPLLIRDNQNSAGELQRGRFEFVSPGYLKTLGTPLVAGREFTSSDVDNKVPVVMVSEGFARKYWHDPSSALGKQVRVTMKEDWHEVIGVVGDIRQDGVDKEAPACVYWPMFVPNFEGNPDFAVRTNVVFALRSQRAGLESLMREVQRAVWSVAPDLPLAEVQTLDYYYNKSIARTSFTLMMLTVAGSMALLLGIVGIYGVVAYSVSQRRREIGVRMALGAQRNNVLKLVLGRAMILTLVGVVIGIVAALGLTRFLSGLLYGVRPSDPVTLVTVTPLLIVVALLASYIPARQAVNVDPMVALRHE